ncbi:MAG: TIGR04053 family radical SAM/SPASM domain-containing protein [Planctomycetes bacterium]|nr:TIGR04053 family radical SAM/SPASM domain-containing protein [Planctomycetota bacterium]
MLVFYEVTQACGLVCKHCRACAQTHALPDELSAQASLSLIEQLADFPTPPMLVLTGGDPFCRDDIFQLIEHANAVGLKTSITPSATPLVTNEAIGRLKQAGIHRMAISIDGADAKTHDEFRGVEGSFARSFDILREARRVGLPTQINTTLTPDNLDQLAAMAEMFAELEIVLWSVFFLVPVGRAEEVVRLSPDDYEKAFEQLWDESQRRRYMIKTTAAPHYRRFAMKKNREAKAAGNGSTNNGMKPPFQAAGINDGKGVMFVGHNGEIFPSGFMPIPSGQYPHDNVVKVYQDSPLFQDLRNANRLEGKCRQCEYRTLCGGSRARAYALTGNPFAEEVDCAYIPPSVDA